MTFTKLQGEILAVGLMLATFAAGIFGQYALGLVLCAITVVQHNIQENRA